MGNLNQYNQINKQINHNSLEQQNKVWAGKFIVMKDQTNNNSTIKKIIYLQSHKEAKQFLEGFIQQNKPQFYVINPFYAELKKQQGFCTFSQAVNVLHKNFLPTLSHKMSKTSQPPREHQIWFILNEISHSLEILHKRNHPHLWICSETIYHNKDDNWFLQDMHYWHGPNYQSTLHSQTQSDLLNQKYKSQALISNHLKNIINRSEYVNISTAFDEDLYCLGYAILEMMNGEITHTEIKKNSQLVLEKLIRVYSKKLVNIVRLMIEEIPEKRLTLEKLRFKLRMEEEEIMKQEMAQFKKIQKDNKTSKEIGHNVKQNDKIKLQGNQNNINQLLLTTKKQQLINTKQSSPYRNINSFPNNSQKKNQHIYFSPPTHRVFNGRNPSIDQCDDTDNNFRFNSPRNF